MNKLIIRSKLFLKILGSLVNPLILISINKKKLFDQIIIAGPKSLLITAMTSFFISLVFSLQIVKEFLYLNATDLVGSMLAISFIREMSPVLTSIVVIGKVGSFFTSEIATMYFTEQIDSLIILGINPIEYLIIPRVIAVLIMLPILNLFSVLTSFISCSFICFIIYSINPLFFLILYYIICLSLIYLNLY